MVVNNKDLEIIIQSSRQNILLFGTPNSDQSRISFLLAQKKGLEWINIQRLLEITLITPIHLQSPLSKRIVKQLYNGKAISLPDLISLVLEYLSSSKAQTAGFVFDFPSDFRDSLPSLKLFLNKLDHYSQLEVIDAEQFYWDGIVEEDYDIQKYLQEEAEEGEEEEGKEETEEREERKDREERDEGQEEEQQDNEEDEEREQEESEKKEESLKKEPVTSSLNVSPLFLEMESQAAMVLSTAAETSLYKWEEIWENLAQGQNTLTPVDFNPLLSSPLPSTSQGIDLSLPSKGEDSLSSPFPPQTSRMIQNHLYRMKLPFIISLENNFEEVQEICRSSRLDMESGRIWTEEALIDLQRMHRLYKIHRLAKDVFSPSIEDAEADLLKYFDKEEKTGEKSKEQEGETKREKVTLPEDLSVEDVLSDLWKYVPLPSELLSLRGRYLEKIPTASSLHQRLLDYGENHVYARMGSAISLIDFCKVESERRGELGEQMNFLRVSLSQKPFYETLSIILSRLFLLSPPVVPFAVKARRIADSESASTAADLLTLNLIDDMKEHTMELFAQVDDDEGGEGEEDGEEEGKEGDCIKFLSNNGYSSLFSLLRSSEEEEDANASLPPRFFSPWRNVCPVALKEGYLTYGKNEFAVEYAGRVFFLSSEDYMKRFVRNPLPYLSVSPSLPSPLGVAFVGLPTEEMSRVAQSIAEHYGIKVLDIPRLLENAVSLTPFPGENVTPNPKFDGAKYLKKRPVRGEKVDKGEKIEKVEKEEEKKEEEIPLHLRPAEEGPFDPLTGCHEFRLKNEEKLKLLEAGEIGGDTIVRAIACHLGLFPLWKALKQQKELREKKEAEAKHLENQIAQLEKEESISPKKERELEKYREQLKAYVRNDGGEIEVPLLDAQGEKIEKIPSPVSSFILLDCDVSILPILEKMGVKVAKVINFDTEREKYNEISGGALEEEIEGKERGEEAPYSSFEELVEKKDLERKFSVSQTLERVKNDLEKLSVEGESEDDKKEILSTSLFLSQCELFHHVRTLIDPFCPRVEEESFQVEIPEEGEEELRKKLENETGQNNTEDEEEETEKDFHQLYNFEKNILPWGHTSRFCPVVFKEKGWLVPGLKEHSLQAEGRLYRFFSEENLFKFRRNALSYLPIASPDVACEKRGKECSFEKCVRAEDNPPLRVLVIGARGSDTRNVALLMKEKYSLDSHLALSSSLKQMVEEKKKKFKESEEEKSGREYLQEEEEDGEEEAEKEEEDEIEGEVLAEMRRACIQELLASYDKKSVVIEVDSLQEYLTEEGEAKEDMESLASLFVSANRVPEIVIMVRSTHSSVIKREVDERVLRVKVLEEKREKRERRERREMERRERREKKGESEEGTEEEESEAEEEIDEEEEGEEGEEGEIKRRMEEMKEKIIKSRNTEAEIIKEVISAFREKGVPIESIRRGESREEEKRREEKRSEKASDIYWREIEERWGEIFDEKKRLSLLQHRRVYPLEESKKLLRSGRVLCGEFGLHSSPLDPFALTHPLRSSAAAVVLDNRMYFPIIGLQEKEKTMNALAFSVSPIVSEFLEAMVVKFYNSEAGREVLALLEDKSKEEEEEKEVREEEGEGEETEEGDEDDEEEEESGEEDSQKESDALQYGIHYLSKKISVLQNEREIEFVLSGKQRERESQNIVSSLSSLSPLLTSSTESSPLSSLPLSSPSLSLPSCDVEEVKRFFSQPQYFLNQAKEHLRKERQATAQFKGISHITHSLPFTRTKPQWVICGPRMSGVTSLAKALAQYTGAVYVNAEELISLYLSSPSYSQSSCAIYYEGGMVSTKDLLAPLAIRLESPDCLMNGYIIDGILDSEETILAFSSNYGFLPRTVIVLPCDTRQILSHWEDEKRERERREAEAAYRLSVFIGREEEPKKIEDDDEENVEEEKKMPLSPFPSSLLGRDKKGESLLTENELLVQISQWEKNAQTLIPFLESQDMLFHVAGRVENYVNELFALEVVDDTQVTEKSLELAVQRRRTIRLLSTIPLDRDFSSSLPSTPILSSPLLSSLSPTNKGNKIHETIRHSQGGLNISLIKFLLQKELLKNPWLLRTLLVTPLLSSLVNSRKTHFRSLLSLPLLYQNLWASESPVSIAPTHGGVENSISTSHRISSPFLPLPPLPLSPEYSTFCPVSWQRERKLLSSGFSSTYQQIPVQYNNYTYYLSSPSAKDAFLLSPLSYLSSPLPSLPPHKIPKKILWSPQYIKQHLHYLQIEGYCPVELCERSQLTRKTNQLIIEYDNKFWSLSTQEAFEKFMQKPWKYSEAVLSSISASSSPSLLSSPLPSPTLPEKLLSSPVSLSSRYLEKLKRFEETQIVSNSASESPSDLFSAFQKGRNSQSKISVLLSESLLQGLNNLSSIRPLHPSRSVKGSALFYLSLFLRFVNPNRDALKNLFQGELDKYLLECGVHDRVKALLEKKGRTAADGQKEGMGVTLDDAKSKAKALGEAGTMEWTAYDQETCDYYSRIFDQLFGVTSPPPKVE